MHFLDTNKYGSRTGTATLRLSVPPQSPGWSRTRRHAPPISAQGGGCSAVTWPARPMRAQRGGLVATVARCTVSQANRPLLRLEVTSPSGAGVKSSRAETRDERERSVHRNEYTRLLQCPAIAAAVAVSRIDQGSVMWCNCTITHRSAVHCTQVTDLSPASGA